MGGFVDSFNNKETAIIAATGCATGFLWSALAGRSDLTTGKGWLQSTYGCVGSAINGAGIYGISRYASRDEELALRITQGWFAVQSAASFTNTLGTHYGWQESPAYNAFAFPLNFGAAPGASTISLIVAGLGATGGGSRYGVRFFGGSLNFSHGLGCGEGEPSAYQIGAVGNYCGGNTSPLSKLHEQGHMVQTSISGDLGSLSLYILNGAFLRPWVDMNNALVVEIWAEDYALRSQNDYVLPKFLKVHTELLKKKVRYYENIYFLNLKKTEEGRRSSEEADYLSYLLDVADEGGEEGWEKRLISLGARAGFSQSRIDEDVAQINRYGSLKDGIPDSIPGYESLKATRDYWFQVGSIVESKPRWDQEIKYDEGLEELWGLGRQAGIEDSQIREHEKLIAGFAYFRAAKANYSDHRYESFDLDRVTAFLRKLQKPAGISDARLKRELAELKKFQPIFYGSLVDEVMEGIKENTDPKELVEKLKRGGDRYGQSEAKVQADIRRVWVAVYDRLFSTMRRNISYKTDNHPLMGQAWKWGYEAGFTKEKIEGDLQGIQGFDNFIHGKLPADQLKVEPGKLREEYFYFREEEVIEAVIRQGKDFNALTVNLWKYGKGAGLEDSVIEEDIINLNEFAYRVQRDWAKRLAQEGKDYKSQIEAMKKYGKAAGVRVNSWDIENAIREINKLKK